MLRRALCPVDPPAGLAQRVEDRLLKLTNLAVEELEGWELRAMRDPRNWMRPVAAVAVGGAAAGALVLVRARAHHRARPGGLKALDRGARDVARGLRRRFER